MSGRADHRRHEQDQRHDERDPTATRASAGRREPSGGASGSVGASGSIDASVVMQTAPAQVVRQEDGGSVEMTEVADQDRRPWWLRLRAAFGILVLAAVLGAAAAAVVGLVGPRARVAVRPRAGMTRRGRPCAQRPNSPRRPLAPAVSSSWTGAGGGAGSSATASVVRLSTVTSVRRRQGVDVHPPSRRPPPDRERAAPRVRPWSPPRAVRSAARPDPAPPCSTAGRRS